MSDQDQITRKSISIVFRKNKITSLPRNQD